jgi:hypothetical protein
MGFFQNASLHEELFQIIQNDTLEACLLPTLMSATTTGGQGAVAHGR